MSQPKRSPLPGAPWAGFSVLVALSLMAAHPCAAEPVPDALLAPGLSQAMARAAAAYMKKNTDATVLATTRPSFELQAIAGSYALVLEVLRPRVTDDQRIYMKYERGAWKVLGAGTGYSFDELKALGVPEALWHS